MKKTTLLKRAKPILFETEMLQAIMDGDKSQARLLVSQNNTLIPPPLTKAPCKQGDVFYVQEIWADVEGEIVYIADLPLNMYKKYRWEFAMDMPITLARLFLRVKSVRVERLQDVTEQDAEAEGYSCFEAYKKIWDGSYKGEKNVWDDNPFVWVMNFEQVFAED